MRIKKNETVAQPIITGKSRLIAALIIVEPNPGIEKIYSIVTVPQKIDGTMVLNRVKNGINRLGKM